MSHRRSRASRFLLACVIASVFILWAPYVGQIRSAIRQAFPGQFVFIVTGVIGGLVLAGVGVAVLQIRERRAARYAAIALALGLATLYAYAFRTGNPEVDAVEGFHFVQYGLVTWVFYRAWRPVNDASVLILPVLAGLIVGVFEEWFQWFIPARIGEVRDVFLNLAAIGCGLLFSLGVDPPQPLFARLHRGSAARIGLAAAALVMVFAAFFHVVHLGYEITDADIGAFRSRYSTTELEALSGDRASRRRAAPPVALRRLSREDQYLSEGVWHVQRRNEAWAAGDATTAWRENLILETFYEPVLDAPSYAATAGHRWPAEQRTDAERRFVPHNEPYSSSAHRYPIFTWSKPLFWTAAVLLAAILAAASWWFEGDRWAARSG